MAWVCDQLVECLKIGASLEPAGCRVIKSTIDKHSSVVFGGDGYSQEWHQKAVEERGLENLRTTADALPVLHRPEIRDLFEHQGVLSPIEFESRFEVDAEQDVLAIEVEARLALRLARTQMLPAVLADQRSLAEVIPEQTWLSARIVEGIGALSSRSDNFKRILKSLPERDPVAQMRCCADSLLPLMEELRVAVDGLEELVDDSLWPLPNYEEMLFMR